MNIRVLKSKYKLYGSIGFMRQMLKSVVKRVFFSTYNSYYLMEKKLDGNIIVNDESNNKVIQLCLEDFQKGDKSYFTQEKMVIYEEWLKDPNVEAYGIYIDDVLAYSAWISYKMLIISEKIMLPLQDEEALLLDAWCHIDYRGRGLHTVMNRYRLMKMREREKTKVKAIVRKNNKPALKTQLKSGLKIVSSLKMLVLFNKEYLIIAR